VDRELSIIITNRSSAAPAFLYFEIQADLLPSFRQASHSSRSFVSVFFFGHRPFFSKRPRKNHVISVITLKKISENGKMTESFSAISDKWPKCFCETKHPVSRSASKKTIFHFEARAPMNNTRLSTLVGGRFEKSSLFRSLPNARLQFMRMSCVTWPVSREISDFTPSAHVHIKHAEKTDD